MSTLLVGDAATSYTQPDSQQVRSSGTYQEAWQFTAVKSGTLTELRFRTNGTANTGLTGLRLGVYADAGDRPGSLLGYGTFTGEPATNSWITATGLSVAIVDGTKYWLAILPLGTADTTHRIHFNTAVTSGGTRAVDAPSTGGGTTAPFLAPWGAFDPDNDDAYDYGPAGFQGLGDPAPLPHVSNLVWQVTGLWYPGETSYDYYGQIVDPSDDGYVDTLNDQQTGDVTFGIDSNAQLTSTVLWNPYARFLKVYDGGLLAGWGPYKLGKLDMDARTCTLSFVDPSLRLSRHVLRRGDLLGTLSEANNDKGSVSVDHIGLRQLRDAGKNSAEQTAEGYPDLGIDDGFNDYDEFPFNRMGVQRLDQVFNQMQQVSQSLGPDFWCQPTEDVVGAYALLNTYVHRGSDISDVVAFHYGTGVQNLEQLVATIGAKYTTHFHVLPRDLSVRYTQANPAAARETGPYVDADATDYDSKGLDPEKVEDVLRAYGDDYLKAYGRPLIEIDMTVLPDGPGVPRYLADFNVGDTVQVAGRVVIPGGVDINLPPAPYRITSVRRHRDGDSIRSAITAVGDMVAAAEDAVANASTGDET